MNTSVALFFVHITLAIFLLGIKFASRKDLAFRYFGIGFILNAIAFAFWTLIVLLRPENLNPLATAGVIFFLLSLFPYFLSSMEGVDKSIRQYIQWVGLVGILIISILRLFVYPSNPMFSAGGLFVFNPQPIMQVLEIFGLGLITLPAIYLLAAKFLKPSYSLLIQYGLTAQVMGAAIMITAINDTLLNATGWIISITYLLLWTNLVFGKKIWTGIS